MTRSNHSESRFPPSRTNSKRKILVTGGGGFLGRHVVKRLLHRGDEIHVLGRHKYPELSELGAVCHKGNICDYSTVASAHTGIDTVFHIAGIAGIWGAREEYFRVNAKGTANVIRACVENKVSRLIYTSSPGVLYGKGHKDICGADEDTPYPSRYDAPYPASKAVAEKMVLAANGWEMVIPKPASEMGPGDPIDTTVRRLATCAIRPHLLWGPGDHQVMPRLISRARNGKLRRVGNGRNMVHLTYVDNAAKAHVLASDALSPSSPIAGQAIFVADSDPVNLWDWINEILKNCELPTVTRGISYTAARRVGMLMECVHHACPFLGEPAMTRLLASMLGGSHYFDLSRARELLGYTPDVGMQEGLRNLCDWIKKEIL